MGKSYSTSHDSEPIGVEIKIRQDIDMTNKALLNAINEKLVLKKLNLNSLNDVKENPRINELFLTRFAYPKIVEIIASVKNANIKANDVQKAFKILGLEGYKERNLFFTLDPSKLLNFEYIQKLYKNARLTYPGDNTREGFDILNLDNRVIVERIRAVLLVFEQPSTLYSLLNNPVSNAVDPGINTDEFFFVFDRLTFSFDEEFVERLELDQEIKRKELFNILREKWLQYFGPEIQTPDPERYSKLYNELPDTIREALFHAVANFYTLPITDLRYLRQMERFIYTVLQALYSEDLLRDYLKQTFYENKSPEFIAGVKKLRLNSPQHRKDLLQGFAVLDEEELRILKDEMSWTPKDLKKALQSEEAMVDKKLLFAYAKPSTGPQPGNYNLVTNDATANTPTTSASAAQTAMIDEQDLPLTAEQLTELNEKFDDLIARQRVEETNLLGILKQQMVHYYSLEENRDAFLSMHQTLGRGGSDAAAAIHPELKQLMIDVRDELSRFNRIRRRRRKPQRRPAAVTRAADDDEDNDGAESIYNRSDRRIM